MRTIKLGKQTLAKWDAEKREDGVFLVIPVIHPSVNVWKDWHWAKRDRYLRELTENITWLVLAKKLPLTRKATVEITYFFPDRRRRDTNNYTPKFLLDALVYAGLILDDNAKEIRQPEPRFEIGGEYFRTEVYIKGER
jgi:crossover junction endodeoxyribonuclease RusA